MLKRKLSAAFLAASMFLFSCGCGGTEENAAGGTVDIFTYEQADNTLLMAAVGETLYTLESDENDAAVFSVFDADGNKTAEKVFPQYKAYNTEYICADENGIYAAVQDGRKHLLCSVDMDDGVMNTITELTELDSIEKIDVCGDRLYWFGEYRNGAKPVDPFITEAGETIYFEDRGKKIGSVDIKSGENVLSGIEFPVSFAVHGNNVTVYAYDSEGGYYFADYDNPDEKTHTNKLGMITNFEFYGNNGEIVFLGASDFTGVLPVSKADAESGLVAVINGLYSYVPSELCASDTGCVWLRASDSVMSLEKEIKRCDLSSITISGEPIRIITNQYLSDLPVGLGSETQTNRLSEEEFALTVLSLDQNYDAAMISSDDGVASEIKGNGSFYPLGDVPGVSEYLDNCFPYIKEAVTDSEGNIRMLPITLEIPLIVYNQNNCADCGIEFSAELEPFARMMKQASELRDYYYDCSYYWIVQTQLIGYLAENNTFDTEKFRELAAVIKEQICDANTFKGDFTIYSAMMMLYSGMPDPYSQEIYDKTLFTLFTHKYEQTTFLNDENLRAAPIPASQNGKNGAVCMFLCVNPYSDRLPETLAYIESLVRTMSSERNSLMLADLSTYDNTPFAQDIYSIYENGTVCFQIPPEIYAFDFEQYCADKITLDEFITEADRKLSAYLNE